MTTIRYCLAWILALPLAVLAGGGLAAALQNPAADAPPDHQYQHGGISIPPANPDEPIRENFSPRLALDYLDRGAVAWTRERGCLTCHTNGSYMVIRPALSDKFGKPSDEVRQFFLTVLRKQSAMPVQELDKGLGPTQAIYVAAGLAEWDAHITHRLSPETSQALELMFRVQGKTGAWRRPSDCWPPFESDSYHGATLAAMAASTAPGWLDQLRDSELRASVDRLKTYLVSEPPPHDYGRVLRLWAASRMPNLVSAADRQAAIDMIWQRQLPDGGWSIRTFAQPQQWGSGKRAEKLRAEPEFEHPASDGHQTGLCLVVLREAGVSADDPRIQRGLNWLRTNQRVSGRWWTRSLNTDKYHFITFSGSGYALLALTKYDLRLTIDD